MARLIILGVLSLGSLLLVFSLEPIPQDPSYHQFADDRPLLNVPNFLNIFSNLPFLLVGGFGFTLTRKHMIGSSNAAWMIFFAGVALVGLGSSYYHVNPDNHTLVWDRLPMTIGFMGLFIAILCEWISPRLVILLFPMCLIGIASVVYWHYTDDLRFYAWVQFFPLLLLVALGFLFKPSQPDQHWLFIGLCLYIASKICEYFDRAIFELSGTLFSGHTAKHFAAAFAVYSVAIMLSRRRLRG